MVERIKAFLAQRKPRDIEGPGEARAAVAVLLRPTGGDAEILLIRRALRGGDPWSGHMAFPGGRVQPEDASLVHTAARETREEVGIDLFSTARLVGRLDELEPMFRGRPVGLVVRPYVWEVTRPVEPIPEPREVERVVWAKCSLLARPEARTRHFVRIGASEVQVPAFRVGDDIVWGLTYRMLESLLPALE